jgi:hypothetical protein
MGRVNKSIEGVFVDIVGTSSEHSSYDMFIKNEGPINPSRELKSYLTQYKAIITKEKTTFEKLSRLEEIIMQLRSMENIDDIKLSLVREYIYARCPFYRNDKKSKDIRIIVDNVEFWDPNMEILLSNPEFMVKAKDKLLKAMEKEISENITNFNSIYQK